MSAPGFAVWVSGATPATVEATAAEIAAALAARRLPVATLDRSTPGLVELADAAGAAAFAASVLARHGVATVLAFAAPRAVRDRARAAIGRLVEVHVIAEGAVPDLEAPERAEVEIVVPEPAPGAGAERTLRTLELLQLIPPVEDRAYSEEEEREVIRRLKAFGYL